MARDRGDATLLDRARAGDQRAWVEIVTELGPKLRGYARAKGAPDPDDVMQDVFLAAASRLSEFIGDESAFRSWIFSIAYRQIANRHRVAGREDTELPTVLVDPRPGPEAEAVLGGTGSDALAALSVLDDLERDVILMRVIGEMDSGEVGEAIGKKPGTVRVIQHRALDKVRAELVRRGYGEARRKGRGR